MRSQLIFPPTKLFKSEESEKYSASILSRNDIEFCLNCIKELEEENHNNIVKEALWNAAIVRFFSCFGVPKGVDKNIIEKLPSEHKELYIYFKNYRDKHIAHRVNPVEQIKVSLNFNKSKEITGIGTVGLSDASYLDSELYMKLKKLATKMREEIDEKLQSTKEEIIKLAKSKTNEELESLQAARVVVPESGYLIKK